MEIIPETTSYVPFAQVIPCCGLGCILFNCFMKVPECFGVAIRSTLCCIRNETVLCKPGRSEDSKCVILSSLCDISDLRCILKSQNTIFCADVRVSVPSDERDAPFLCTLFFFTFYHGNRDRNVCYCCRNGSEIINSID